jgi:hypothetical protein
LIPPSAVVINVREFQIAMDDALSCATARASAIRVAISSTRLDGKPPAGTPDQATSRRSAARQEVDGACAAGASSTEHSDDAGVVEGGEGFGLALESRDAFGIACDVRRQDFSATSRPSLLSVAR